MNNDHHLAVGRSSVVVMTCFVIMTCVHPAVAGKRNVEVVVESNPPGALVSVHPTADTEPGGGMVVAGETPLTKTFRFPKKSSLWLRFEKRGYDPLTVEVRSAATQVTVDLALLDGEVIGSEPVMVLAVVTPDLMVIRRGFAKEREDESAGEAVAAVVARAIADRFADKVEIVEVNEDEQADNLRRLWRDAKSQMELVDPIRLPYLPVLPTLESRSARTALLELSEQTGADAVLFVAGKTNVETGGMKAGKVGIMAVGTASSFASGYSNAMANGHDFFTYNIYLPSFAEGLGLEALLVDARSSAIRWANKGLWKPIPLDRPEIADAVVADLLSGLEDHLSSIEPPKPSEEEP
jgi:hypothetical protein